MKALSIHSKEEQVVIKKFNFRDIGPKKSCLMCIRLKPCGKDFTDGLCLTTKITRSISCFEHCICDKYKERDINDY